MSDEATRSCSRSSRSARTRTRCLTPPTIWTVTRRCRRRRVSAIVALLRPDRRRARSDPLEAEPAAGRRHPEPAEHDAFDRDATARPVRARLVHLRRQRRAELAQHVVLGDFGSHGSLVDDRPAVGVDGDARCQRRLASAIDVRLIAASRRAALAIEPRPAWRRPMRLDRRDRRTHAVSGPHTATSHDRRPASIATATATRTSSSCCSAATTTASRPNSSTNQCYEMWVGDGRPSSSRRVHASSSRSADGSPRAPRRRARHALQGGRDARRARLSEPVSRGDVVARLPADLPRAARDARRRGRSRDAARGRRRGALRHARDASGRSASYPMLAYSVAYELEIAGVVETLEPRGHPGAAPTSATRATRSSSPAAR